MGKLLRNVAVVVAFGFLSTSARALEAPPCLSDGRPIPIDNDRVLAFKETTKNQFHARAHIKGKAGVSYPTKNKHLHFPVSIGSDENDTIEIVFNLAFDNVPPIQEGAVVEACGDYITSIAQSGPYPPSPDGAIMHWVHQNPRGRGHEDGYMIVDGVVYGRLNDLFYGVDPSGVSREYYDTSDYGQTRAADLAGFPDP